MKEYETGGWVSMRDDRSEEGACLTVHGPRSLATSELGAYGRKVSDLSPAFRCASS